jgi:predicted aconitase
MHIKENRYGTDIFDIQCKSKTIMDWDIIGYTIGRLLPAQGKPIITGDFERPDTIKLKQCFASLATTSGAEICHIVGITVEAPDLETALAGHEPRSTIVVSQKEYDKSLNYLCTSENVEIQSVILGCPHYSLEEVRDAANYLKGKKVHEGVSLWIWTDMSTEAMAEVSGYAQTIRESGAHLLNSSCPLVMGRNCLSGVTGLATDGAKQAHYLHSDIDAKVFFGTREQCIDAAIRGRWEK